MRVTGVLFALFDQCHCSLNKEVQGEKRMRERVRMSERRVRRKQFKRATEYVCGCFNMDNECQSYF